ncbi:hypothetical protein [Enterocloster clostridioformis]|uniref:Uncharacterized protein n=1 Tax=Enterocloster clostridioformis TaxID=1531 RepID=A0A829WAN4_9FIRM|nr:hypothetical protein [Enterocloster clostridioformis]GEA37666.1 hypothetical protein Ccl03g_33790 [Enterocloster clostridioformis]
MNLIFEPDKLFTTIEVWNNEVERDTFLSSLLDVLDYVNNHDDIYILWNDEIASLLWETNIHPWKLDKSFYKSIMPSISHILYKNTLEISLETFDHVMECNPDFTIDIADIHIKENFYHMLHQVIHNNEVPNILVTSKNDKEFNLICFNVEDSIIPLVFTNLTNDFVIDNEFDKAWGSLSSSCIIELINKVHNEMYYTDKVYLYDFCFDSKFIKDIKSINSTKLRIKIITQIIKKLVFSFTITQNDKSLDDEMIGEFTGRFRISQGKRIEYIYQNNQIIFTL